MLVCWLNGGWLNGGVLVGCCFVLMKKTGIDRMNERTVN